MLSVTFVVFFQLSKRGIAHQGIQVDEGIGGLALTLLK